MLIFLNSLQNSHKILHNFIIMTSPRNSTDTASLCLGELSKKVMGRSLENIPSMLIDPEFRTGSDENVRRSRVSIRGVW